MIGWRNMFNLIFKTIIIYFIIIIAMRLMGKRQVGELQPYELVITILIAEITSTPMDSPGTPLIYGLIPALTLLLVYYLIAFLSQKSLKLRKLFGGTPSILIMKGKLQYKELKNLNYNLNDLQEQIRNAGYTKFSDINYAILESNGSLSVFPHAELKPASAKDLNLEVQESGISYMLIQDGKLNKGNMELLHIDPKAFCHLLKTFGFIHITEILVASLSEDGELFIALKNGKIKTKNIQFKEIGEIHG